MNETNPLMGKIAERLELLTKISGLPLIWKVGNHASVTLLLPQAHHRHCHPFCEKVKQCGKSFEKKCIYNDEVIVSSIAAKKRKNFINRCHAGASELIIPIFYGDSYMATLFIGPFRSIDSEDFPDAQLRTGFECLEKPEESKLASFAGLVDILFSPLLPNLNASHSTHLIQPTKYFKEYPAVVTAMDYAKNHFRHEIKISDVAARCNMSISNFQHYFKRHVSYSFSEYLLRVRVLEAERLLLYTNLSTGEIAGSCRLTDQSRLTMLFRRYYGNTPATLRRQNAALPPWS